MKRRSRHNPFSLFSFQDIITGLSGIMIFFVLIMLVDVIVRKDTVPTHDFLQERTQNVETLVKEISALNEQLEEIKQTLRKVRVSLAQAKTDEERVRAKQQLEEKEAEILALLSQVEALGEQYNLAKEANAKSRRVLAEMEAARRKVEADLQALKKNVNGITLIAERGISKSPVYIICERTGIQVINPLDKKGRRHKYSANEQTRGLYSVLSSMDKSTHSVVILVRPSGLPNMDSVVSIVKNLGFTYGRDPLEEHVDVAFERVMR